MGFVRWRAALMADRCWRETAHYQVVDRGLGIKDMASVFLCPGGGRLITLNCGRDRGFRASELEPVLRVERVMTLVLRGRQSADPREKRARPGHAAGTLTRREKEVLHWVREGKRNSEIAIILALSPHTIRKHLENIYRKLGVETRAGAANARIV